MARSTIGITLVVFGMILTLVGGFLQMLCLIGGGVICSGTMTGEFANTFLLLGLPPLVAGVVLWPFLSKREPRRRERFVPAAAGATPAGPSPAKRPAGRTRVASDCPKCGGPVKPSQSECEWCGEPLL